MILQNRTNEMHKYIRIFNYDTDPYIKCQESTINDSIIRFRNLYKANSNQLKRIISFTIDTSFFCVIDYPFDNFFTGKFRGIHLKSKFLYELKSIDKKQILYSASCHNIEEIKLANSLSLDYIIISPVKISKYQNKKAMGWDEFNRLSKAANMPTYALGGMNPFKNDYEISLLNGGLGIAGMKYF